MRNSSMIGVVSFTKPGARQFLDAYDACFSDVPPSITVQLATADVLLAQRQSRWDDVVDFIVGGCARAHDAGATFAVVPANSIHHVIDDIQRQSPIPVIDMVATAAQNCRDQGWQRVLVLGVASTVDGRLYEEPLKRVGIDLVLPGDDFTAELDRYIYENLVPDLPVSDGHVQMRERIEQLVVLTEADGLLLACSELSMVIDESRSDAPLLDANHSLAVAAYALASGRHVSLPS